MYQFASKNQEKSEKSNINSSTTNNRNMQTGIKIPVQTKSLFSPSFDDNKENSTPNHVSSPAQLTPQQNQREIQPLSIKMSENQKKLVPIPTKSNHTGIPLQMKERFENLSGFSFDDVKVHYNSDKPAQLQALAYTQGNQVYVAPDQEKHLGHELGHIIQQKLGIVRPTDTLNGLPINDDMELEKAADVLAKQPIQRKMKNELQLCQQYNETTIQRKLVMDKLNVVGEDHDESDKRRLDEKEYCFLKTASLNYWLEPSFTFKLPDKEVETAADSFKLRIEQGIGLIKLFYSCALTDDESTDDESTDDEFTKDIEKIKGYCQVLINMIEDTKGFYVHDPSKAEERWSLTTLPILNSIKESCTPAKGIVDMTVIGSLIGSLEKSFGSSVRDMDYVGKLRSQQMDNAATLQNENHALGVWKIGDEHVMHIKDINSNPKYNLVTMREFNGEFMPWSEKQPHTPSPSDVSLW